MFPAATAGGALLAFVAFLAASEAVVRYLVEPEDHFAQHVGVFYKAVAADAVFGDSIAANGMILDDPEFVNLASPSEGPLQILIKLRHYYAARAPGRVVIGANMNLLGRRPGKDADYDSIFGLADRPLLRILEPGHRRLIGKYWQVLLLKGEFRSKFRVLPYGGLVLAAPARNADYAKLSEAERDADARREVLNETPNPDRIQRNIETLRQALAFLVKRGAEVCLVTFPKSPAYRRVAADSGDAPWQAQHIFAELAVEAGVRYVNLWSSMDDPRYYQNVGHLTEVAGRAFAVTVREACFGRP